MVLSSKFGVRTSGGGKHLGDELISVHEELDVPRERTTSHRRGRIVV
jgi:hypothetical protein